MVQTPEHKNPKKNLGGGGKRRVINEDHGNDPGERKAKKNE